jgi:CHAT domain-containing protein
VGACKASQGFAFCAINKWNNNMKIQFNQLIWLIALSAFFLNSCVFPAKKNIKAKHQQTQQKNIKADQNTIAEKLRMAEKLEKEEHFSQAEHIYQAILKQQRKTLGESHLSTISTMASLATVLEKQALYARADPLYKQVLKLTKKQYGTTHNKSLQAAYQLAQHFIDRGQFAQAEDIYRQTLEKLRYLDNGADSAGTVNAMGKLAHLHILQTHFTKAITLLEKVVESYQQKWGDHHVKTLHAQEKLANAHHLGDNLDTAETHIKEVINGHTTTSHGDHWKALRSKHKLGHIYHKQGRHKEASTLLKSTLKTTEKTLGEHHPHAFDTLNTLAGVKKKLGDHKGELALRRVGFLRRTKYLDRLLWLAGGNTREGYIKLHQPELDHYLAALAKYEDNSQAGALILEASLQRKGLLHQVTSSILHVAALSNDPKIKKAANKLTELRKELAKQTMSVPQDESPAEHLDKLTALDGEINRIEAVLGKASLKFDKSLKDATIEHLQAALPDNSTIVDFIVFHKSGKGQLLAGVLRKKNGNVTFHRVVYKNWDAILISIGEYRELIQDEDSEDDDLIAVGKELYDLLWLPLQDIISNLERVYLVPDGLLNITPFQALVDKNEDYLIQNRELHYLTSSRDLLHPPKAMNTGDVAILAGPDFSSKGFIDPQIASQIANRQPQKFHPDFRSMAIGNMHSLQFDPLIGAQHEGEAIREILNRDKTRKLFSLQGADVQESAIRSFKKPPEILHIATHGFFITANPDHHLRQLQAKRGGSYHPSPGDNPLLRAGLVFAGINQTAPHLGEIDSDNDGILTAFEVLSIDLTNNRVVVLSACETGLGEIHEGEGVYGLRRAFMEAGAGAVINSIWEVSDAGTKALMTDFYKNLSQGISAPKALRRSQLNMIKNEQCSHP